MEKLIKLNKYAVLAHSLSFVGVLCLYLLYTNSHKHATAVIYRNALAKQSELESTCNTTGAIVSGGGAGQCITDPVQGVPIKTKVSFNIIYGCLFFFALTAYAHIFYATDGFGKGSYTKVVAQGWNPYRWAEYGISASVMSVLIGYALGVTDLAQLANFALITAAMQGSGYVVEAALKQKVINRQVIIGATVAGWLLFVALWGPLLYTFWSKVNDVNLNYNDIIDPSTSKPLKIPNFVWFIVTFQLLNYALFGIIQAKQVSAALKGMPLAFPKVESQYLKLSFAGKLALAGGLSYGLIFRTKNCTT
jgi:hypothetical protein